MSERLLLLPESKSPVLASLWQGPYPRLRLLLVAIGLLVVLVGAADALSRFAEVTLGDDAARQIFAPAVVSGANAPAASSSAAFVPARIAVPSVGITAEVVGVGNKSDGSMDAPKNFSEVGWYTLGAKPGASGNAVFAGHVNNALMKAGVFAHLKEVSVGDYVSVSDASGKTLLYRVHDIEQYPADEAPVASIFSMTGPSQLVLYTCDGEWDSAARSFDKRLVVFAKQV